jgi:glycosyltransferase involved in cell wall biosynthesis
LPKISIITPIYCDISQKVDWLDETIQSVISQTVADWEMILIDDKSPLPLNSIKFKYSDEPRLRWFENAENSGPAATRNTAVGLATSDCILPLDSDDMLAGPEVLEAMYDAWVINPSIIIYGNLQTYTRADGSGRFQRNKIIELGQYTFELAMNLEGLMPVTAMHSKECHLSTYCEDPHCLDGNGHPVYGWKSSLREGLEDLEYWIAAGKKGFCGQKIDVTTLIYRRQEESRAHKLKHDPNPKFRVMQNKIKEMHSDVYSGRFPVACCGKQASVPINDPIIMNSQASEGVTTTSLIDSHGQAIDEKHWKWKQYRGAKKGSFAKISRATQIQYMIQGDGHTFPIHEKDEMMFRGTVRDIFANVPDPRTVEPEPEPELEIAIAPPAVTEVPRSEMSTIVRMDSAALEVATPDIQEALPQPMLPEVIIEPNPPSFISDTMSGGYPLPPGDFSLPLKEPELNLSDLGLTEKLTDLLASNEWTVELLAVAKLAGLTTLPGIGEKRANFIIAKAKELIKST